ncbi:MAG: ribosome small subunit-dependent GTPase A [Lachnospiraceae bacterium]|nr:ribosome small subunit-dependent GTPase A [Lachnospiraceae bacterium]
MQEKGRIIKGIAGFYYVQTAHGQVYECKAKGSFRNDKMKPLVGDYVRFAVVDEEKKKGNIELIEKRKNELIRPAVANIDQALVIFASIHPEPNFHLLDTFLARMELLDIPSLICFNKSDLDEDQSIYQEIEQIYRESGYPIIYTSAKKNQGIDELKQRLKGKCTTVAGPSGVGKSSLINLLQSNVQMETSDISQKTARGRHTTRHSELIALGENSFIMDTPGFTSLRMDEYEKEDISRGFREIYMQEGSCRFAGCSHIHEPDCGVKEALCQGKISKKRYDSYVMMYEECKEKRRY